MTESVSKGPYVGQVLGEFIASSTWESIPPSVRHESKRSLLNFVGGALGASADPVVATAVEVLLPFSGEDRVTVIGRSERLDAMGASFVNALGANLRDYDDTHWNTAIHPAAPVIPALLALAEQRGYSGAQLLHAVILGVEVECRIGNAVSPEHYARGWHITATCGVFGAAAGCAKLLNLDAAQTWTALGLAASQSAGVIENLPTGGKNLGVGNAARHGLLAALFAKAGYTAGSAAIEGPLGWARAMGDEPKLQEITGQLAQRWEFQRIAYKPYPCGFVFHAEIDACLQLRERLGAAPGDIREVLVRGNQLFLDRGDRDVVTERDARVSIKHVAAVALARGTATLDEFSAAAIVDPVIQALRDKVRAELAAHMPTGEASVTVTLRDGRSETAHVRHPRGSLDNPLTDEALEAKFKDNARYAPRVKDPSQLIERIWSVDTAGDLRILMRLMAPS